MLLPNLARLDLRRRLEGIMIGGDADSRKSKRLPLVSEETKAKNKAAKQERSAESKAKAQAAADAARTVAVIEEELKTAKTERDFEARDEKRQEELHQKVQALEEELEEKMKQSEKQITTFTAEDIRSALHTLVPKLEDDDIKLTVAALQTLRSTYANRIDELQRNTTPSPAEHGELVALREANTRIREAVVAAKKAAPRQLEKRLAKERHQRALDAVDDPKNHLERRDDAWWETEGERVWNKLRKRAEDERLRKGARLDPSDAKPSVQEGVIDLSKIAGSSNEERAAALTQQLAALGTQAIKSMTEEIARESAALNAGGNAFDGAEDSEDEDDV